MSYIIGQGEVFLSERDPVTGAPIGFVFIGNVPEFTVTPGMADSRYAKNSAIFQKSGNRSSCSIVSDEFLLDNIAPLFWGKANAVSSGSAADLPLKVRKGYTYLTGKINLSSMTVQNATKTVTYTNGVDYSRDLVAGTLYIISAGSIVDDQDILVSVGFSAFSQVGLFTTFKDYYWVRFNGLNLVDDNKPIIADLFKVSFDASSVFNLLDDKFLKGTLTGKLHYDTFQPDDELGGRLMRVQMVL